MACGTPVASLDVGAARAIVGMGEPGVPNESNGPNELDGLGGFVAPAGASAPDAGLGVRATALADCVARLLALLPEERAGRGAAGREHVLARYGLDTAVERWAAHFESLGAGQW